MSLDLDTLEYPRHLHRGEEYIRVDDAVDAAAKLKEGWTVWYRAPGDTTPIPESQQLAKAPPPAPAPVAKPAPTKGKS